MTARMHRSHRVAGALVGSAVGDALGAPFAFATPGQFSKRFPAPARGAETEMCGGGRFTEVTQTALAVGTSLLQRGDLDDGHQSLATTAAAIWFARSGAEATAGVMYHELMRVALDGEDPLAEIDLPLPEHSPLGQAVCALRNGRDFAEVLRLAIDLGGDTATVAALAGGLAGAVYGMPGIPMRWSSVVHGPGVGDKMWRLADLQDLAWALDGRAEVPFENGVIPQIGPAEVLPGIWAANLDGARLSGTDFAVVSLCRVAEPFGHSVHRMAYLADNDHNTEIDVVLDDILEDMAALRAEGRQILVHCHGGASRTGLVLRAWLRRTEGMSAQEATDAIARKWPYLGLWNASFTAALARMR